MLAYNTKNTAGQKTTVLKIGPMLWFFLLALSKLCRHKILLSFFYFFNYAITAGVKNWHVMQSQGPIMITVSCVEAPPKVMSCLAVGTKGKSRVAGSCPLYYVDVCGPWVMAQRVSALPSTCKHTRMHTHKHTRAYQSWLERRECLPTSLPACLPAGLERPGLKRTGTINVGFHVFHVLLCYLSACVRSALVFVWGMCVVWSGGKFHVTFRWRSLKGCFGVQSLI